MKTLLSAILLSLGFFVCGANSSGKGFNQFSNKQLNSFSILDTVPRPPHPNPDTPRHPMPDTVRHPNPDTPHHPVPPPIK